MSNVLKFTSFRALTVNQHWSLAGRYGFVAKTITESKIEQVSTYKIRFSKNWVIVCLGDLRTSYQSSDCPLLSEEENGLRLLPFKKYILLITSKEGLLFFQKAVYCAVVG